LTFNEALPAETRDAILGTLCNDSDPVSKDFALATQGIVKRNAQLQNQTEGAVGSGN